MERFIMMCMILLLAGCLGEGSRMEGQAQLPVADDTEEQDIPARDDAAVDANISVPPDASANITTNATLKENRTETARERLKEVRFWAYQIQDQEWFGNMDKLVASRYDMFVIDQTRSIRDDEDDMTGYDMASDVRRLKGSAGRLVIAYIDIGEAEDYRWYWQDDWEVGDPGFILTEDPDGWSGNYPVRYWESGWRDIAYDYLDLIIEDGFDGIYMDWIEGYENEEVIDAAESEGKDARDEMIDLVCGISNYTKTKKPGFIVIAQNAVGLGTSSRYLSCIDGVSQEQIWFDGLADAEKGSTDEGDYPMPETGQYGTLYYISHLKSFQAAGIPVFSVDYAQKKANADKAYSEAYKQGYVPYVSIRSLSRLTETPPPGY